MSMARENGNGRGGLASRVGQALDSAVRSSIGPQHFGLDGRLARWSLCLVPGIDETLLRNGGPLDVARLRQPDNATALAVNSFLNWQRCPHLLHLAGQGGFRELRFEARCPTGIRGTPPLLDLVAVSGQVVVAVTARCAEYLGQRRCKVAVGYAHMRPIPALLPWIDLLSSLQERPRQFRYVDAPALIKHAIGLGRTFPNRTARLLYLFWEPVDAAGHEPFREHRAELAGLAARVAGSAVSFAAQSFHELWAEWEELSEPDWLRGIVARLKFRYGVAMADMGRL
jgi:hypothetical protein